MRAEILIEQYSPDLTPAFKDWLVQELCKHHDHEQRAHALQQQPADPAPQDWGSGTDSDAASPYRPAQQQAQLRQQQQPALANLMAAAPAAAAAQAGRGGGSGLEALRARMNQLQAKSSTGGVAPAHGSAPGALVGTNTSSELPGMTKAPAVAGHMLDANAISDGGIGVVSAEPAAAAGRQQAGRSINDIKSRFHNMNLGGH